MKAKLIVFPIRGRNWCFSRSIDHTLSASSSTTSSQSPSSLKQLWKTINTGDKPLNAKAELFTDYVANMVYFFFISCKFLILGMSFPCSFLISFSGYVILMQMNNGWVGLEKAPDGSFKKKIHGSVVLFLLHYYCQVLFLIVECGFGFLQIRVMAFV
jgi:hypothetical protein